MTTVHAIRGYVTKRIRARGRGAAIIGAAGTSLLSRGLSIITSLSTVPIVLHHLGPQRYGVWMAAIALSAFFTMADGGVTKGLIAEVAKAHGAHDRAAIRRLISSALTATVTFVVLLGVAAVLAVGAVDWTWAFNLSDPALGREARNTILTIVLCYGFSWIATVIREARVGMLQAAAVNLWDATGLALGFAGIAAAAHFGWGLVAIAGIWTGGPALMRAVSALWFLRTEGRDLVPTWRDVDAATCRRLVSAGSIFVIYALTTVLATQCDQVLIARFLGPEAVTQYTIVQRLFQQPQVLVMLGLVAQWPAYGEALGRGDTAWIRRHFRWSLPGYAAFAAVLAGLLVVFGLITAVNVS